MKQCRWIAAATVVGALAAGTVVLARRSAPAPVVDQLISGSRAALAHPSEPPPVLAGEPSPSLVTEPAPSDVQSPATKPVEQTASRASGTVVDESGHALADVRVLSGDLMLVLGRTGQDGSFDVSCGKGVVFAAYAFGPDLWRAQPRASERSPGIGNYAFRTLDGPGACGDALRIVLPEGGVIEGTADAKPGQQVYLSRVTGGVSGDRMEDADKRFGSFFTTVRADGTYRIEGLATGRYSIESSYEGWRDEATFVDVHEGATSDGSYSVYVDPANYYDPFCPGDPNAPECAQPSPSPTS